MVYSGHHGIFLVCESCKVQFRLGSGPRSLGNFKSFIEAFEERHPTAIGGVRHSRSKFIKFGAYKKPLEKWNP